MYKKAILCLAACLLFSLFSFAQQQDHYQIDLENSQIIFKDGFVIDKKTSIETVLEKYGQPERGRGGNDPDTQTDYIYDELGLAFSVHSPEMNHIMAVAFTFNTDGDKSFATGSYKGRLSIGNVEVAGDTPKEYFMKIPGISYTCPMEEMCVAKGKKINSIVGFTGERNEKVSQVIFKFN